MKAGPLSAALLALLYSSPVLGVAIAHPQDGSEEIIVADPNSETPEVIDIQPSDLPPAIDPNDQGVPPESPSQDTSSPNVATEAPPSDAPTTASAPPASDVVPEDPDLALPSTMPIAITAEDGTSALASLNEESNSTVTADALTELAGAQANIEQMAQTVALKAYEVSQAQDVHSMDITFQGERGKLGVKLGELPQNEDGSLQNINECQASSMEWIDDTPVTPTSLSLGGTFTNGVNALLYRDENCMNRIDEGNPWPPEDLTFKQGDRITFYFKLIGLTEAQLKGGAPLPNGVVLPPL
ncbi:hypothetical protein TWF696_001360 [Orbilia brochopaga]|uniref:Uncharacterized protein n=1 Tax=Orbilia brochopaga TaxID=3140254 RepID=A0AAV9UCD7_9PEZI